MPWVNGSSGLKRDIKSTAHSVHDRGELDENAVTGGLHDPPAVFGDLGVHESPAMGLELGERAFFVSTHQAAVASHIGCQEGCEPSLYTLAGQGMRPSKAARMIPLERASGLGT